ncbi:porin family protein [Marinoscillum sp. MHG1-6]|uniref:porin family protein n=1 Tax=Marinoscillum sp. MHG1-6 TaxID=2959627 RepID=UPI0021584051|nr:porin family protein [Marinoscillum sp. MHG1-6]
MKKFLILISLLSITLVSYSQAKVELGLKGGLNMAKISSDESAVDLSNKTGYHFGVYGLIKVASIGIQPEILYSTKGTEVSVASLSQDFSQEYSYLDIPVMLKLYTIAGLNVQAGPQFGMLLSTSGKNPDGTSISKSDFKDSDVSAAFGLGWDAPFGLNVTARYILGLSDISSDGTTENKNRMFQLSLGYKLFGLGK